jgi:hypothetical protein
MSSTKNKTEELLKDSDYLNELNEMRREAESLRDNGLKAIIHYRVTDNDNWEKGISNNERVLFRRAKHLAYSLGILDQYDSSDLSYSFTPRQGPVPTYIPPGYRATKALGPYPEWPVIGLPTLDGATESPAGSVDLFNMDGEPAPILFAANYLITRLSSLEGHLDEGSLLCYYRILRELYNLHETNWALGGARAGERSGPPSVFVTTECTRALGYFARIMENTAELLKRLHKVKAYIEHVHRGQSANDLGIPPLHSAWCASELDWCTASVTTTIESFRSYVAIRLPIVTETTDISQIIALVEESVRQFVERSRDAFCAVTRRINKLRMQEEHRFKERRRKRSRELGNVALEQWPEYDLTETAHRLALGALAGSSHAFNRIRKHMKNSDVLREVADLFTQLAEWMRKHLDPAKEYFEKNLHRCLVENRRERNAAIVQDLAFSALSLGFITKDWDGYAYECRQALKIMCHNLNAEGEFPVGPPYAYADQGGRNVINAQFIRAFAQLAQHQRVGLNPKYIRRMIQYFKRHAIEHPHGIAWPSPRSIDKQRGSLWISVISVLALHRVVLMLDEHINRTVKNHFITKSPAALRREGVLPLDEMMCSDIGYASLNGNAEKSRRVVMELEAMRGHLVGVGRARTALGNQPLCSLILYGPPGTGKTTLVKSLAVTSNVDLIEVSHSDLFQKGSEYVEEQASAVMKVLSMLTSTLVLFDEFDSILSDRDNQNRIPASIMEMLPGSMLPRFSALNSAAKKNRMAYVLTTNYVERIDAAALRVGRFDERKFVYYPDAASRICRLVSELRLLKNRLLEAGQAWEPVEGADLRLLEVAAKSARCSIASLCRKGWFVGPREIKARTGWLIAGLQPTKALSQETDNLLSPVWSYIIWNQKSAALDWSLFGSVEVAYPNGALGSGHKTLAEQEIAKQVRSWDDSLRDLFNSSSSLRWQQALELVSTIPSYPPPPSDRQTSADR